MSKRLLDYLLASNVKNLYTLLRSNTVKPGVYSVLGPILPPHHPLNSYFKTPYRPRRSLNPEAEFSQAMMGIKTFQPYKKKESYFQ